MHKPKYRINGLFLVVLLLSFLFVQGLNVSAQGQEVYVGGMPAGFTLGMGGAQVVGVCEVLTEDGTVCPARAAGMAVGDIITNYGGLTVRSAEDIGEALSATGGRASEITVLRDGESLRYMIKPALDLASGKQKLGILIRDSVSGIGTVTYIQKGTLRFGSLGHAVMTENGKQMDIAQGAIYRCSIVDVVRGERGKAGELKGLFLNERGIAIADKNCSTGIYGNFSSDYDVSKLPCVEVGTSAQPGRATIYTTIDGVTPQEYSISIVKVDIGNRQNKNFVLKITDPALLSDTGGIVQGMSGSPILQDGKLVGAVTHVFLNDPTRGYGISIENMLGN